MSDLDKCLSESELLDLSKISSNIRKTIEYLRIEFDDIVVDSLLISVLSVIAQVCILGKISVKASTKRLIQGKDRNTLCNMYAITFMPSGEGKDKAVKLLLKTFCQPYFALFNRFNSEYMIEQKYKIEAEAEQKFGDSAIDMNRYKNEKEARRLIPVVTDGTSEGLTSMRHSFQLAGFGGVTVRISEFGDFILAENQARYDFMSIIGDMFDDGSTKAKVIKGDKVAVEIVGVPNNFFAHTSFYDLLEGSGNKKLKALFNRGFARRSFICFPQEYKYKRITTTQNDPRTSYLKDLEDEKIENELLSEIDDFFKNMTESFANILLKPMPDLWLEMDTEILFRMYLEHNAVRIEKMNIFSEEAIRAEIKHRHWKALKLSGMIAMFEHPDDLRVRLQDAQTAIYIAEFFGEHFGRFYKEEPGTAEENLMNFFIAHANEWIPMKNIKESNFVGKNKFNAWFKVFRPDLEKTLTEQGFSLQEYTAKHNIVNLRVVSNEL